MLNSCVSYVKMKSLWGYGWNARFSKIEDQVLDGVVETNEEIELSNLKKKISSRKNGRISLEMN